MKEQLQRVRLALQEVTGQHLTDTMLAAGIRKANEIRRTLAALRRDVFAARLCPLPALEMLIAEMLAIHFCSDRQESLLVLKDLLGEVQRRMETGEGFGAPDAVRSLLGKPGG